MENPPNSKATLDAILQEKLHHLNQNQQELLPEAKDVTKTIEAVFQIFKEIVKITQIKIEEATTTKITTPKEATILKMLDPNTSKDTRLLCAQTIYSLGLNETDGRDSIDNGNRAEALLTLRNDIVGRYLRRIQRTFESKSAEENQKIAHALAEFQAPSKELELTYVLRDQTGHGAKTDNRASTSKILGGCIPDEVTQTAYTLTQIYLGQIKNQTSPGKQTDTREIIQLLTALTNPKYTPASLPKLLEVRWNELLNKISPNFQEIQAIFQKLNPDEKSKTLLERKIQLFQSDSELIGEEIQEFTESHKNEITLYKTLVEYENLLIKYQEPAHETFTNKLKKLQSPLQLENIKQALKQDSLTPQLENPNPTNTNPTNTHSSTPNPPQQKPSTLLLQKLAFAWRSGWQRPETKKEILDQLLPKIIKEGPENCFSIEKLITFDKDEPVETLKRTEQLTSEEKEIFTELKVLLSPSQWENLETLVINALSPTPTYPTVKNDEKAIEALKKTKPQLTIKEELQIQENSKKSNPPPAIDTQTQWEVFKETAKNISDRALLKKWSEFIQDASPEFVKIQTLTQEQNEKILQEFSPEEIKMEVYHTLTQEKRGLSPTLALVLTENLTALNPKFEEIKELTNLTGQKGEKTIKIDRETKYKNQEWILEFLKNPEKAIHSAPEIKNLIQLNEVNFDSFNIEEDATLNQETYSILESLKLLEIVSGQLQKPNIRTAIQEEIRIPFPHPNPKVLSQPSSHVTTREYIQKQAKRLLEEGNTDPNNPILTALETIQTSAQTTHDALQLDIEGSQAALEFIPKTLEKREEEETLEIALVQTIEKLSQKQIQNEVSKMTEKTVAEISTLLNTPPENWLPTIETNSPIDYKKEGGQEKVSLSKNPNLQTEHLDERQQKRLIHLFETLSTLESINAISNPFKSADSIYPDLLLTVHHQKPPKTDLEHALVSLCDNKSVNGTKLKTKEILDNIETTLQIENLTEKVRKQIGKLREARTQENSQSTTRGRSTTGALMEIQNQEYTLENNTQSQRPDAPRIDENTNLNFNRPTRSPVSLEKLARSICLTPPKLKGMLESELKTALRVCVKPPTWKHPFAVSPQDAAINRRQYLISKGEYKGDLTLWLKIQSLHQKTEDLCKGLEKNPNERALKLAEAWAERGTNSLQSKEDALISALLLSKNPKPGLDYLKTWYNSIGNTYYLQKLQMQNEVHKRTTGTVSEISTLLNTRLPLVAESISNKFYNLGVLKNHFKKVSENSETLTQTLIQQAGRLNKKALSEELIKRINQLKKEIQKEKPEEGSPKTLELERLQQQFNWATKTAHAQPFLSELLEDKEKITEAIRKQKKELDAAKKTYEKKFTGSKTNKTEDDTDLKGEEYTDLKGEEYTDLKGKTARELAKRQRKLTSLQNQLRNIEYHIEISNELEKKPKLPTPSAMTQKDTPPKSLKDLLDQSLAAAYQMANNPTRISIQTINPITPTPNDIMAASKIQEKISNIRETLRTVQKYLGDYHPKARTIDCENTNPREVCITLKTCAFECIKNTEMKNREYGFNLSSTADELESLLHGDPDLMENQTETKNALENTARNTEALLNYLKTKHIDPQEQKQTAVNIS